MNPINRLPRHVKDFQPPRPRQITNRTTISRIWPTISVDILLGVRHTLHIRRSLVGLAQNLLRLPGQIYPCLPRQPSRTNPFPPFGPLVQYAHHSRRRHTFHNLLALRRMLECRLYRSRRLCRILNTIRSTLTRHSTGMVTISIPISNRNRPVGSTPAPAPLRVRGTHRPITLNPRRERRSVRDTSQAIRTHLSLVTITVLQFVRRRGRRCRLNLRTMETVL